MALPIDQLQDLINYKFMDKDLLRVALTHSSTGEDENYERLEFLGDRVLGLIIASMLYQKFPDEKEGDLAKRLARLVQGETLAQLSSNINLGEFIIFSESVASSGGAENVHILADVFESIIGAMYLDGGYEPCKKLVETNWKDVFFTMKKPPQHPKTALQEWAQAQGFSLPSYTIIGQKGPDHEPTFEVELVVTGHASIISSGKSRAEAEKNAAHEFMKSIDID